MASSPSSSPSSTAPTFPPTATGTRLLSLLHPLKAGPISDRDSADLLAYIGDYGRALGHASLAADNINDVFPAGGDDGNDEGTATTTATKTATLNDVDTPEGRRTFRSVVLESLRAAHRSTSGACSGSGATAPDAPPPFTPKISRRVLSDALLPLASIPHPLLDGLVTDCVEGVILGCAVTKTRRERDGDDDDDRAKDGEDSATSGNDDGGAEEAEAAGGQHDSSIGIELVLPSYLARIIAVSSSSPTDSSSSSSSNSRCGQSILDALCSTPNSGYALRPHRAAAVASALRELESIVPGTICSDSGTTSSGSGKSTTTPSSSRAESLIASLITSLSILSTDRTELDSLPPLVYQLCLLPSRLVVFGGNKSFGGGMGKADLSATVLSGIASVFDGLQAKVLASPNKTSADQGGAGAGAGAGAGGGVDAEAIRWAISTSLTHIAAGFRSDPLLVKAALKLVRGDVTVVVSTAVPAASQDGTAATTTERLARPFRYQRLTPFLTSLALTLASTLPRSRTAALEAVRDLVVEEQVVGVKRDGSAWFDSLASDLVQGTTRGKMQQQQQQRGHVLSCLLSVINFALGTPLSSSDTNHQAVGGGGADFTGLLTSLVSLGFLLIDCVKKDGIAASVFVDASKDELLLQQQNGLAASGGAGPISPLPSVHSVQGSSTNAFIMAIANGNASRVGRKLLTNLFARAGGGASASLMGSGGLGSASSSAANVHPLCRSILQTASEKFCGMAPNAVHHSFLLRDLVDNGAGGGSSSDSNNGYGDDDDSPIDILSAGGFTPTIIDHLSSLPSGGLPPAAALASIIPAISALLHRQRTKRRRRELGDNVDHAFLLAKKVLFCTDTERRCVSVNILVMLLGVVVSGSSPSRAAAGGGSSSSGGYGDGTNASSSSSTTTLDEIRGYLRRCLTQHPSPVRDEVYACLVALLPCEEDVTAGNNATTAADGGSGPSSPMPGGVSSPVPGASPVPAYRRHRSKAGRALCSTVSDVLSSQLDRYVTPMEDGEERAARLDRAVRAGSQLSQPQVGDSDDDGDEDGEVECGRKRDPPLRINLCVLGGGRSSSLPPNQHGIRGGDKNGGRGKGKKKQPYAAALLTSATSRIVEPLPRLLASCSAVVTVRASSPALSSSRGNDELRNALGKLTRRVAESKLDDYLSWCDGDGASNTGPQEERTSNILSTSLLVASVAETLMGVSGGGRSGEDPGETTERLYKLRTDAVERATLVLSTPPPGKRKAKKKKKASAKKKKGKSSKCKAGNGENENPNLDSDDDDDEEMDFEGASSSGGGGTKEIKQSTLDKSRRIVEDTLAEMCPALSVEFLSSSLRSFGASAESTRGGSRRRSSQLTASDEGDGPSPQRRLISSIYFRRYLIEKTTQKLEGGRRAVIVRGGRRLDPRALSWRDVATDDDSKSLHNLYIAASLQLGPLLFAEFCEHAQTRVRTSLNPAASASSSADMPLAQLALRGLVRCTQRMAADVVGHQLSKAKRVSTLLLFCVQRAMNLFPSTKNSWNVFIRASPDQRQQGSLSKEEVDLRTYLLAFASPGVIVASGGSGQGGAESGRRQGGLLTELIANSLDGEAAECCALIACAASVLDEPNARLSLGTSVVRCWDSHDAAGTTAAWDGVLGLDHGNCPRANGDGPAKSAVAGMEVALLLGGLLDGETPIPSSTTSPPSSGEGQDGDGANPSSNDALRRSRSVVGMPLSDPKDWPEAHRAKMDEYFEGGGGSENVIGIGHKLSSALLVQLGIGHNFEEYYKLKGMPSKKNARLSCVEVIASSPPPSGFNVGRELGAASTVLSSAIDSVLADAEFVATKLLPHLTATELGRSREFASGRLLAVARIIGTVAGCAEGADDHNTFVAELLRSCKRLYGIHTKLVQSQIKEPQSLVSTSNRLLLTELAEKMTPRAMGLLLTMQEKNDAGEGKFMTDSKIESQGKIAAQVVFEKERMDSFLTKACAKLKTSGMEEESSWLEKQVVQSVNRDFKIKAQSIRAAREREAPAKKGKKRASSDKSGKKNRKKSKSDDSDQDEEGSIMDAASIADEGSMMEEASVLSEEGDAASSSEDELTDTDEE